MGALKKFFYLSLLTFFTNIAPPCRADSASLGQAEKLFQSGDWEKARQAYKTELSSTPDPNSLPPAFFYNYGTSLARAGAPGEAYISLLRSGFALPFDSDIKHNLRMVESQMPAAVRAIQPSSWIAWWPNGLRVLPWKLWLVIALAFSAAGLVVAQIRDRGIAIGLGLIAGALFVWGALAWSQMRFPVYGAVTLAKVKSGPGATFSDITTLEPGSLVSEEQERDGWLKVRFVKADTSEETVGWVEPASVLRVL